MYGFREDTFLPLCFALATGVGKTRLMGAFIAYLYLAKNIRNFFVLRRTSPSITSSSKIFPISQVPSTYSRASASLFTDGHASSPETITKKSARGNYSNTEIHINIFNIGKINAETRGGKSPRIKRLGEYLGDSYFNYLTNLDDLVVLMDESHHYRADRGMEVINELNPIIGLELTATPQVERSGGAIKFRNVVYRILPG